MSIKQYMHNQPERSSVESSCDDSLNLEPSYDEPPSNTFQRSGLETNNKYSYMLPEEQLRNAQIIASLKLQNKILAVFDVLLPKVNLALMEGFLTLKNCQLNDRMIAESQRQIFVKITHLFVQRLSGVLKKKTKTSLSRAFGAITISSLENRMRGSEKSDSCVSPYRIHSKIEQSERFDSEWELAQSQGYDRTQNAIRENKFLKQKKKNVKSNHAQFFNKMDQLLTSHETYLKRK